MNKVTRINRPSDYPMYSAVFWPSHCCDPLLGHDPCLERILGVSSSCTNLGSQRLVLWSQVPGLSWVHAEFGPHLNDQDQSNRVPGTRGTYRPIGLERLRTLSSSHIAEREHQAIQFFFKKFQAVFPAVWPIRRSINQDRWWYRISKEAAKQADLLH